MWNEWEKIPQKLKDEMPLKDCIVGKYQYIYTEGKIRISLIRIETIHWGRNRWQNYEWEICGGGLTDDVEKFPTKKDAVKRIKELINER